MENFSIMLMLQFGDIVIENELSLFAYTRQRSPTTEAFYVKEMLCVMKSTYSGSNGISMMVIVVITRTVYIFTSMIYSRQ